MSNLKFSLDQRKSVLGLSGVLALRMVGLFLIVPVFALHANEWKDSTPILIGIALGIYGLSQALFQIPFGAASDVWGRKRILTVGLIVFAVGSVIAAESSSIFGIIVGRALQGGGAIAAVVLAFIGDLTRESQRPKALAILGVSIGSAFTLSLMLGPVLAQWVSIRGLFWISCILALIGVLLVWTVVADEPVDPVRNSDRFSVAHFKRILGNVKLILLASGSLMIHAVMTAVFLVYPIALIESSNLDTTTIWKVFVPVLLASFIAMIPLIRVGSDKRKTNLLLIVATLLIFVSQGILLFGSSTLALVYLVFGLWLYFVGFNVLEALLPSTAFGTAPKEQRGTAMGVFSTCTFAGAFLGGLVGGFVYEWTGSSGVFLFSGTVILLWIILFGVHNLHREKAQLIK